MLLLFDGLNKLDKLGYYFFLFKFVASFNGLYYSNNIFFFISSKILLDFLLFFTNDGDFIDNDELVILVFIVFVLLVLT